MKPMVMAALAALTLLACAASPAYQPGPDPQVGAAPYPPVVAERSPGTAGLDVRLTAVAGDCFFGKVVALENRHPSLPAAVTLATEIHQVARPIEVRPSETLYLEPGGLRVLGCTKTDPAAPEIVWRVRAANFVDPDAPPPWHARRR